MPSLLVTNDFPPKHGGIQSYLYELWRRLPPDETTVLTTAFPDAAAWDAQQEFRVERVREKVLLPTRAVARRHRRARTRSAGRRDLPRPDAAARPRSVRGSPRAPYVVVAHGSEITGYARTPGSNVLARRVMRGAAAVVAAGSYPARAVDRRGRTSAGRRRHPSRRRRRAVPSGRRGRTRARPGAGSVSIPNGRWCSACRGSCRARASTS